MKRMIMITMILILLAAVFILVAALLPVAHVATVRATYHQSPEALWSALTDIAAFPSWRGDLKSVEVIDDDENNPMWKETSSFGTLTMQRGEAIAPRRLVGNIVGKESGFGGKWIYEITPAGSGSTLTITEQGEVYNPLFRIMSRFIFGYTKTMKGYLRQLGAKFGEKVEPEVVASGH